MPRGQKRNAPSDVAPSKKTSEKPLAKRRRQKKATNCRAKNQKGTSLPDMSSKKNVSRRASSNSVKSEKPKRKNSQTECNKRAPRQDAAKPERPRARNPDTQRSAIEDDDIQWIEDGKIQKKMPFLKPGEAPKEIKREMIYEGNGKWYVQDRLVDEVRYEEEPVQERNIPAEEEEEIRVLEQPVHPEEPVLYEGVGRDYRCPENLSSDIRTWNSKNVCDWIDSVLDNTTLCVKTRNFFKTHKICGEGMIQFLEENGNTGIFKLPLGHKVLIINNLKRLENARMITEYQNRLNVFNTRYDEYYGDFRG